MALINAGYSVVLATPNGTRPHVDEASDSPMHFGGDKAAYERARLCLSQQCPARGCRAALIAGDEKKAKECAKGWPYAGYKMTIFSASEEKWVENDILHAKMYFNMPYALTVAGGEVSIGSVDFELNVIVDRELITSQNPRSDHPIATKLLEALASSQSRGLAAGRD